MWTDVKGAQSPTVRFREDVFLEHALPDYSGCVADYRGVDAVALGDEPRTGPRRAARGRVKDAPVSDPRSAGAPLLGGLSDDQLLRALEEIVARHEPNPQPLTESTQRVIEEVQLTVDALVAVMGEVAAWAPKTVMGRLASSRKFWLAAEVGWGLILSPIVDWLALAVEMRRATEAHRVWGMRAGVRRATLALIMLSIRLRDGRDVPGLTIPAVTSAGNVDRQFELRKYVATARAAVELERFGFVHEKFLAGYDLVIAEVAKLARVAVEETDELVRRRLRELGLTRRQARMVLESGAIDLKPVYAVTFEGLARLLGEHASRFGVR